MTALGQSFRTQPKYTERVIQFGEGNFLRAFVDWQLDILNEKNGLDAGIVIVRPIDTNQPSLNEQDSLYTTVVRGIDDNGETVSHNRVITSVTREVQIYKEFEEYLKLAHNPDLRFIFSNTTEAGIVWNGDCQYNDQPQVSFPAKLTRLLHERFVTFEGAADKGLVVIPCELIDYNGDKLFELIKKHAQEWKLEESFTAWLETACTFCSTLVDRIVTGYPRNEIAELEAQLGYEDKFLVTAEYFHLFVIQGPAWLAEELKLEGSELNIKLVDDIRPYKERKVAILNGAHTAMVPVAMLQGIETVGNAMSSEFVNGYVRDLIEQEVIPSLDLPKEELETFANAVYDRFSNPFIAHRLQDISLNSMSKFKTRLLPQMIGYSDKFGQLPKRIVFSMAALMALYRGEFKDMTFPLNDDGYILEFFEANKGLYESEQGLEELAQKFLGMSHHWDRDLNEIPELTSTLAQYLNLIIHGEFNPESILAVLK
ncbi:tagaturonate reductase [Parendozoicomonas haliclonae]|uniref:Altronate oxidoreductase n=1 Tax=Parendozoicomonas haliclonae TaxID=1960125 RepID=A0A1X7AGV4_9GAMM|nr:tagaturonate reductase [Parendozoicomonas haliclonae]SMA39572.1 Altronate oxidoreductase [Parendozoicomonas haliclonae]